MEIYLFVTKAKGTISIRYATVSSYTIQAHKILVICADYFFAHSLISPHSWELLQLQKPPTHTCHPKSETLQTRLQTTALPSPLFSRMGREWAIARQSAELNRASEAFSTQYSR